VCTGRPLNVQIEIKVIQKGRQRPLDRFLGRSFSVGDDFVFHFRPEFGRSGDVHCADLATSNGHFDDFYKSIAQ